MPGLSLRFSRVHFSGDRVERRLGACHLGADAGFDGLRRLLELVLEFLQLVELDLAADVGLHVVDVTLKPSEQVPKRTRHRGQALGADHHERNHGDQHQLGKTDVKHGGEA